MRASISFVLGSLLLLTQAGSVAVAQAAKTHVLPAIATDATSNVSNMPNFMVLLDEGGTVPSEPKATCDNRAAGNSRSNAGVHLEHYFPDAKATFDQKVGVLRQYMGLKQAAQSEAGSAPVVFETIDGAEAAYFVATGPCIQDANPASSQVSYMVRVIHDTTYADIRVTMYAASPDAARKYAREMLQKISALNYAALK